MRKFRWHVRRNKESPEHQPSIGFGLRLGWWPCLRGPYLQVAFLYWRLDMWHGLPSYRDW